MMPKISIIIPCYNSAEFIKETIDSILGQDYPNVQYDSAKGGGDGISFANEAFSMTTRALATNGGTVFLVNRKGEGREIVVNTMGAVRIVKY